MVGPPVGPSGTAGWATGLPEQAMGTTAVTQHQNPISRTMLNYVAGQNSVPMPVQCGISHATGAPGQVVRPPHVISVAGGNYVPPSAGPIWISGWPAGIPPPVGPSGTTGWATGLPEQAMGMAQAIITGVAGPIMVPQYPQSVQTEPSQPTVVGSAIGEQAAVPGQDHSKAKSLLKLLPLL